MKQRMAQFEAEIAPLAARHSGGQALCYDRIALSNSCDETIWAALRYEALKDEWFTRGCWEVAPGESAVTALKTRNSVLCFFAEGDDSEWNGDAEAESEDFPIIDWQLIQRGDEPLEGTGNKTVSFFKRTSGSAWQTYTQDFSCGS